MSELTAGHPFAYLQTYAWLFPLGITILIPSLCIGFYAASLYFNQLNPIFPFVSDAGALAPQAGYFSQVLDMVAILVFATALFRYRQLRQYITSHYQNIAPTPAQEAISLHKLNRIAVILASIAAFFLLLVGNFRTTESNRIHSFSAFTMIALNLTYFVHQAIIARRLHRAFNLESPPTSMVIFTVFGAVSYIVCFAASVVSIAQFGEEKFLTDNQARLHWSAQDPGFVAHVVGTFAEWTSLNAFPALYGCLARRMRHFERETKV